MSFLVWLFAIAGWAFFEVLHHSSDKTFRKKKND